MTEDPIRAALVKMGAKKNPSVNSYYVLLRHGLTVDADLRKLGDTSLFIGEAKEYLKEKSEIWCFTIHDDQQGVRIIGSTPIGLNFSVEAPTEALAYAAAVNAVEGEG